MIAYLQGKIAQLEPTYVIVDCQGVGYMARISLATFSTLQGKNEAKVFTYLQVREDAHILFGFAEPAEQQLFEQLISISGVGGNTALMILSSMSAEELVAVIRGGDEASLKRVKGIGGKTAARIVLELKDKIKIEGVAPASGEAKTPIWEPDPLRKVRQEALIALQTLGFTPKSVEKKVDQVLQNLGGDAKVEDIIKAVLKG
ncbi:MAG: Holliday junction branch migration protein RuvA [Bacteroidota bacterium]